jgi:cytochrome c nitrite reductase small subunit
VVELVNKRPQRVAAARAGALANWWPLGFSVGLGVLAGVGSFTFAYAKGLSYFSTDPVACVNCHVMQPQYDGWQKASHHAVAVCVDCHLPESLLPKYIAKAENGWRHGQKFTTQDFEEPIHVRQAGLDILQANCVRCHADLVEPIIAEGSPIASSHRAFADDELSDAVFCIHCHATVGHGERAGLGGPLRTAELESLSPLKAPAPVQNEHPPTPSEVQ